MDGKGHSLGCPLARISRDGALVKFTMEMGPYAQVSGDLFVATLRLSEPGKLDDTRVFAFTPDDVKFIARMGRATRHDYESPSRPRQL